VSAKLCDIDQRALPIFGRAAMTLDIGPHFSIFLKVVNLQFSHVGRVTYSFSRRQRSHLKWDGKSGGDGAVPPVESRGKTPVVDLGVWSR